MFEKRYAVLLQVLVTYEVKVERVKADTTVSKHMVFVDREEILTDL